MTTVPVPELDDIAFEELVEEARSLIPRFAPDWTDHNLHDPGITVIDLLAHLVDQQVYRIGQVGPSLERAFTRLMGVAPRPATPARLLVWPPAKTKMPVLDLERLSPIRSSDLPDGRFLLDADLRSTGVGIDDIALIDARGRKSVGPGLAEGRETLTLFPAAAGGPWAIELVLDHAFVAAPAAGPVSLGVAVTPGADAAGPPGDWEPVILEERAGSTGPWRRIAAEDRTGGLARSGVILFRPDPAGRTTHIRLRLDLGFRPGATTLERLDLNVLPVREGARDIEEVVGVGTGLPDQVFAFSTANIDEDETPLVLESATDDGLERWTEVPDFTRSGPGDRHAIIDREAGTLQLGNGVNGRMLELGRQLRHRPVIRLAGEDGNVAKGLRWTIAGHVWGENVEPADGGRDREGLDDLVRRAREVAAMRTGALTGEALAGAATGAGFGLAGLYARSGHRPGGRSNGSRTLVAIPARQADRAPGPPRQAVAEALMDALAPARLLGERLHVSEPVYVNVDVTVSLEIVADADRRAVEERAEALIRSRLWDLPVGRGNPAPWPPGRPLGAGDIRALVARVEDVVRMSDCVIRPRGEWQANDEGLFDFGDRGVPIAADVAVVATPIAGRAAP